jgi:4-hydroxy-3-methylbut-2-enyl diphosphate reductase
VVQDDTARRQLNVFDATCPLVTKVHMEVTRYARDGREVVLIGHAGHPEVEGTMGQFDNSRGGRIFLVETPADVGFLDVKDPARSPSSHRPAFRGRHLARGGCTARPLSQLGGPRKKDICYATQNRQDAVKSCSRMRRAHRRGIAGQLNSNRLREIAEN